MGVTSRYNAFSEKYNDIMDHINFIEADRVPKMIAETEELKHLVNNDNIETLDYGCGTGRSGLGMKKYGLKPTHGVDGSDGMMGLIPEGIY